MKTKEMRNCNRKCKLEEKYRDRIEVAYLLFPDEVTSLREEYKRKRNKRFGEPETTEVV